MTSEADTVLVINAGSSSIKFSVFSFGETPRLDIGGQIEGIGAQPRFVAKQADGSALEERRWSGEETRRETLLAFLMGWLKDYLGPKSLRAVGHRIVLGGARYASPVRITPEVLAELTALIPWVPLHQPANLAPVRIIAESYPALPQVACFDTAFHHTIPALAQTYGLPRDLTAEGLRGYGFHGLSYEYIASRLAAFDPRAAAGRTVVAHLGSGASLCALVEGRSVACTLGFSALDGLLMGTRPGRLDPGILLYLLQAKRMDVQRLEKLLYQESGLLGVSGISSDMRDLLASPRPEAREAIDLFVYRAARELGSMVAAARGLDALVFTAGVGQHSPPIRAGICARSDWLGIRLDETANRAGGPLISAPDSAIPVWVIPTDEESMIARHTWALAA